MILAKDRSPFMSIVGTSIPYPPGKSNVSRETWENVAFLFAAFFSSVKRTKAAQKREA
jgi:hypothetical protein